MERAGILKNKLFLYLTEFFAGMSVMAVELGASRLLAPYFSSSQIVWTIIIGTIMIAMALGNIYGGKSADKSPNPDKLYGRIDKVKSRQHHEDSCKNQEGDGGSHCRDSDEGGDESSNDTSDGVKGTQSSHHPSAVVQAVHSVLHQGGSHRAQQK